MAAVSLAYAPYALGAILVLFWLWLFLRFWRHHTRQQFLLANGRISPNDSRDRLPLIVGLFHPYCHAGGGGERVLWSAVRTIQSHFPGCHCVVYTGDMDATPNEILSRAQSRFGIVLTGPVDFVHLRHRKWVEDKTYPRLTLLGQSLGSMLLGMEAFLRLVPDVFFDTMGYAFTYPLFKLLGGCQVWAYVHYPTISSDMLQVVARREQTFNNRVARNPLLSRLKLQYYLIFAELYGLVGRFADIILVNSTWTKGHIDEIWEVPDRTYIVYPPCDCNEFQRFPVIGRQKIILSIGQFRPEKNHALQLRSFHKYLTEYCPKDVDTRLVLLGGCRNEEDQNRVLKLESLAAELSILDRVDFIINAPYATLKKYLATSLIGLHTMWNEHFGISVVEYMAAGLVTVAHDSGGPRLDIVVPFNNQPTGFLASTVESFAKIFDHILNEMSNDDIESLQQRARRSASRFSDQVFEEKLQQRIKSNITDLGK